MTFEILLDVAIGVVLVFALTSILASAANEIFSAFFNRRGRLLEEAIYQWLSDSKPKRSTASHFLSRSPAVASTPYRNGERRDDNLADLFFRDSVIKNMGSPGRLPSFIAPEVAGRVVSRMLNDNELQSKSNAEVDSLRAAIELDDRASMDEVSAAAAELFKHQMDRVSGWYKRRTQMALFFIGVLLAVSLNIDTIRVATELADNANLRERTAIAAEAYELSESSSESARVAFNNAYSELTALCLPVGWYDACSGSDMGIAGSELIAKTEVVPEVDAAEECNRSNSLRTSLAAVADGTFSPLDESCEQESVEPLGADTVAIESSSSSLGLSDGRLLPQDQDWGLAILGWMLTGAAAAMGAPFWFDLLGRLVNTRSTGLKPGEAVGEPAVAPAKPDKPVEVTVVTPDAETIRRVTPIALNAYEEGLTDEDCIDVALVLGFPEVEGKSILLKPEFREALRKEQSVLGLKEDGQLSDALVTNLFSRKVVV